ncbi:ABC transporter permease [Cellulomonas iranensis]|uniref:ABC-type transport system involved in multi-copper enzyme maturation permease subunit n=1 Tax=Cellulomonas iranensis TaxID=76862 RepID=A0ABU0GK54_9CELL|nr:ABC transporter permease subunit [Cellulomonas iranensis]MDQ0425744.1 ABC-type transport system involved in multi-copper enzyme maturation permease subunit [Cellulomonas iranensis]
MTVQTPAPAAATPPAAPPAVGTWTLTWHGVRTVAALELRQRVRSSRWKVALLVWFAVVAAITLLAGGVLLFVDEGSRDTQSRGVVLGAVVTVLVLGLGLLVTPTLTSTAVNGDRGAGTLATLQVTLLSPVEIALGKLLAAWASACAFLVVSLPFYVIALLMGGVPVWTLPRVLLLTALLLAAVCGIGLGWSARAARPAGSTVLTFVTVAALTVFSPVFFGLTFPFLSSTQEVQVYGVPDEYWASLDDEDLASSTPPAPTCEVFTAQRTVAHTEGTWWLLAINPFVIVADGALPGTSVGSGSVVDEVRSSTQGVRDLRLGEPDVRDECGDWGGDGAPLPRDHAGPVWPYGLAANLLLGGLGFVTAVRRLRIPQRTLPRGTRVA